MDGTASGSRQEENYEDFGADGCRAGGNGKHEILAGCRIQRIRVLVNVGMVTVTIRGGKLAPPTKAQREAWNRQKYNGVCYEVKRTGIFGLTIWSSKSWDVD